ncbi:response regulator [Novosphingobium mathurense]|uniref:Response regulator receiver domain-containing protein n=1 Tax=Novosphingobium mathurense TaxID=428990 RepID=A0A1U6H2L4_9SPHN|nr:response regulator [Novosphingobium mathurense]SLJ90052.1 Response regulator receiver domain-containing protein [Novosphingobium mathurense]
MVTEAIYGGQCGGLVKSQGGVGKAQARASMGVARMGKRRCVLIADDARSVAVRLADLVGETGQFEIVGPVYDGLEAKRSFEAKRPDAVILDFAMPLLSGLEVVQAIRKVSSTCFIIVLTNQSDASVRQRCLAAGADQYLHKSRDFEAVPGILAAHFERIP